jgi:hypothetical protein
VPHEIVRKERHVARRDEDGPVPRGEETGFDAGERALAAGTQIRDPAGPGGDVSPVADDEYLLAAGGQGAVDPVEQRGVPDLQRELVPAHSAAPPAGQYHTGGLW